MIIEGRRQAGRKLKRYVPARSPSARLEQTHACAVPRPFMSILISPPIVLGRAVDTVCHRLMPHLGSINGMKVVFLEDVPWAYPEVGEIKRSKTASPATIFCREISLHSATPDAIQHATALAKVDGAKQAVLDADAQKQRESF